MNIVTFFNLNEIGSNTFMIIVSDCGHADHDLSPCFIRLHALDSLKEGVFDCYLALSNNHDDNILDSYNML